MCRQGVDIPNYWKRSQNYLKNHLPSAITCFKLLAMLSRQRLATGCWFVKRATQTAKSERWNKKHTCLKIHKIYSTYCAVDANTTRFFAVARRCQRNRDNNLDAHPLHVRKSWFLWWRQTVSNGILIKISVILNCFRWETFSHWLQSKSFVRERLDAPNICFTNFMWIYKPYKINWWKPQQSGFQTSCYR